MTAQFFSRVGFLDKLLFTKHLAVLVKSGIPLAEGLELLRDQATNSAFKKVLSEIISGVSNGKTLSATLSRYPKIFDSFYTSLINVGEQSGNLEKNLEYLAASLQKQYEFKKKVSGAMLYPVFVLVVGLVIASGISIFVLPQFVNLFSSMDIELPITTKILIFVATTMRNYGIIIIPLTFALFVLFSITVRTRVIKPYWHRFLLNLPIFGSFIQSSETGFFCRNLGVMIKSGLPISRAFSVLEEATGNIVFKTYVHEIREAIDRGKTIESEMALKRYRYFPKIVPKMVGVGEKTGKIDETLLYLADFYDEEVDLAAKNLPSVLEPILLVIVASMVLFLALAIIGPIYDFTGSIRR